MAAQALADTILQNALNSHQDNVLSTDLLRTIRHRANLLYETELVRDQLCADPFERFEDIRAKIDRLAQSLRVSDIQRTTTLSGYSYIDATVEVPITKTKVQSLAKECNLQLSFRFEKEAPHHPKSVQPGLDPPTVWYSIALAEDSGPKETVMRVQVWADGNEPKRHLTAVNLDEEEGDEDRWEDMSEENDVQESKRPRRENQLVPPSDDKRPQDKAACRNCASRCHTENEQSDRFSAAMDPDAVHHFLENIGLDDTDEATAFFLLMTFPFYESAEWDLVGYVLESVFGYESDDDKGGDETTKGY